jgi:hypothetical protein
MSYVYVFGSPPQPAPVLRIAADGGVDLKSAVTRRFSMEEALVVGQKIMWNNHSWLNICHVEYLYQTCTVDGKR